MLLSICIPNFNRSDSLENCLNSIAIASDNVKDFKFEVCISDNCSENLRKIKQIIFKYKKILKINFKSNNKNIGFALNAIKVISMSKGKYCWLIGNDDLILPNTLNDIKKLFLNHLNLDFFFVNSFFLKNKNLKKYGQPLNTKKINLKNLDSISRLKYDKICDFWEVIDNKVSWDFLIGIFLSIFKRDKWIKSLKILNFNNLKDKKIWSNFENTCIHPIILASAFKKSKVYCCSKPLTINLIGEREWSHLYEFIEIVRIPELLDFYYLQGMPLYRYLKCKNFALRNFFNFFIKILTKKKGGLEYFSFRKHFFYNLIYPNVYLSPFYFLTRKIKKFLK